MLKIGYIQINNVLTSLMIDPPQICVSIPKTGTPNWKEIWYGYAWGTASTPPTILDLTKPTFSLAMLMKNIIFKKLLKFNNAIITYLMKA